MAEQILIKPITAKDLEELEARGITREVRNGQWVIDQGEQVAAGQTHGNIGARFIGQLQPAIEDKDLGRVYQDQTTYVLEGTPGNIITMVIPEVSVIAIDRIVKNTPSDYHYLAPDLAIEIISPSERNTNIRNKLRDYLKAGTKQVWHVYPDDKEVDVKFLDGTVTTYKADQKIPYGDLLPGFQIDLAKIFKE